jgi:predicted metal-binding membrane protein
MEGFPDSLSIALWIVGSCWALAILAYLFGASTEWILPLLMLGLLTGIAEWLMRRKAK